MARAWAGSRTNKARPECRLILMVALALALVGIAGVIYWRSTAWESTDNAQIDGFVYPVSSRVSGHVARVMVDDNQYVEAGTVLVQLDPKDYEVAVAIAQSSWPTIRQAPSALKTSVPITSTDTASQISSAQADIDRATAGVAAAERQFEAAQASLRQAEANDLKAQDDVARYKPLAAKDEIPQQQYTTAVSGQRATAAAVEAARASAAAAEDAVSAGTRQDRTGKAVAGVRPHGATTGLGAALSCSRRRGGDRALHRGVGAGATESHIHDDRRAGRRPRRATIRPAGTERRGWTAAADHRASRQQQHLGDSEFQGNATEAHATGTGRRQISVDTVRAHYTGTRPQHRRVRAAHATACCRRKTRRATTSKWSSASPSRSSSTRVRTRNICSGSACR